MGLDVLLRLLAALQILPRLVSPADPLPAPTVSADPQHPMYFPGERLTLRCSAPLGEAVSSYQFYNQRGERVFTESSEPPGGPWLIMTTEVGKAGVYSCEYWAVRDGQHLYSARSQPVWVPVMDLPAAPSISATASGPWDDLVTIVCSLTGSYASNTFQMFKNGHIIKLGVTPIPQGTRLQLHTSDPAIAGSYACSYETDVAGRKAQSWASSPISIHLPASPGAPSLSLNPSRTVYLPGETVTLMCSVPPGAHTATGFQFSRDGGRTVSSGNSNMHALIVTDLGDSGSYTCAYWIRPSQWGVRSQESQPVSLSVTEPPGAPSLSLNPSRTVYLPGETITLTCSVPPGAHTATGFQFSRDGDSWSVSSGSSNTHALFITGPGDSGSYTCAYWIHLSRWGVQSHESQPVSISVTARPPPPTLSLDPPQPVYLRGERVALRCVAPKADGKRRYRFFKQSGEQHLEELPAAGESDRLDLGAQMGTGGTYTCGYQVLWSERWISSGNSPPIAVSLTDPRPKPVLRVDPSSGAVSEGLSLNITCKAPGDTAERRFHFYKDGPKTVPGAAGSESSTTEPGTGATDVSVLRIPQAGLHSSGEFTCGYEENVQGRWVPSPRSLAVNVTVTAKGSPGSTQAWPPLIPLIAGGLGAAAVFALLLLVCLCRRKKDGVTAQTQPVYINTPSGAGLALQERSPDGRVQPATHNRVGQPSPTRGKPVADRNPQERGEREEDADSRAGCNPSASITVYSKLTYPRSAAQRRGGNSEAMVYSEILA